MLSLIHIFSKTGRIDLKKVMSGENGAERVQNYSIPMAEGLVYNYAAKQVDDCLLYTSSFFQNPIAGPYVLGISSGAKLVVALTMIFLLEKGIMVSSLGMVVAAFAGSLLAMGDVYKRQVHPHL